MKKKDLIERIERLEKEVADLRQMRVYQPVYIQQPAPAEMQPGWVVTRAGLTQGSWDIWRSIQGEQYPGALPVWNPDYQR